MKTVEIESDITAVSKIGTVSFFASGKDGVLTLPEIYSPARAIQLFSYLMNVRSVLRILHRLCLSQGIGLTVIVSDRTVLCLGDRCNPGPFSRLLGVYPVELKLGSVIATIIGASGSRRSGPKT